MRFFKSLGDGSIAEVNVSVEPERLIGLSFLCGVKFKYHHVDNVSISHDELTAHVLLQQYIPLFLT